MEEELANGKAGVLTEECVLGSQTLGEAFGKGSYEFTGLRLIWVLGFHVTGCRMRGRENGFVSTEHIGQGMNGNGSHFNGALYSAVDEESQVTDCQILDRIR